MKIGLIVYSQTGNTLQVAEQLLASLKEAGHDATLEQITAQQSSSKPTDPWQITYAPNPEAYDLIYFAAPVQAFSLCMVMKTYLAQLSGLTNKRVACFVTQQLPKGWMGGNRAIRQMRAAVEQKSGTVMNTGIVHWGKPDREQQIQRLVGELATVSPVIL